VRGFIDLAFRITQVILDAPPCCISELSHLPAVCNPVQQSSPRVRTRTSHVHSSLSHLGPNTKPSPLLLAAVIFEDHDWR
jgi:hypothetical protein